MERTSDTGADMSMNGQKLEAVTSLKYLGAILLSRHPQRDRHSQGSDGQINQKQV